MTAVQHSDRVAVGTAAARNTRLFGWWYVAEHKIRGMRAYLASFFIIGIGSPVMYLVGLGAGLALLINERQQDGVDGVSYLAFLAPALLLSGAMLQAAQENTFGVYGGFKWTPIFLAMSASPISAGQIVAGFTIGTLARVVPGSIFYLAAMYAFGVVSGWGPLLIIPIVVLLSAAVGLCVMAWVSTQTNDRGQLSFIERFIMTPLILFSGTYFPLDTLPSFLQWIGWVSPLWHAAQLGRVVSYGSDVAPWLIAVHIGYLLLLVVIGAVLSVRHFRKRLDV